MKGTLDTHARSEKIVGFFTFPALRKLTEKASRVEGKFEKRNIIQQYSNFDSQVYAPMTRIGVYLDNGSEQYNVKSKFSTTLDGMSGAFIVTDSR